MKSLAALPADAPAVQDMIVAGLTAAAPHAPSLVDSLAAGAALQKLVAALLAAFSALFFLLPLFS